ncbi:MAG: YiiX/YebB-like N1pC/P60 family cysteine hydrolase [Bacteroidetes bacterium]|jgi:hypothetical protein|nr:YiiX/YebB-like N1pC/P60 family cysteine hydrolase [Bacteroidota bacterium]
MKKYSFLLFAFCILLSCNKPNAENTIQEGDILFQNLDCGDLCNAIETVTEGIDGKKFSHCSLVIKENNTLKVVEAIGGNVQINSLYNFMKRSGDTAMLKNITVGRVKKEFKNLISTATYFAKQQVGKPYDDEFIMDNGKWYCSELLYEAFKQANNGKDFFTLAPMTFKDPKTNDFFPAWIKYYKDLNKEIPEGKMGINPGLMSRNTSIEIVDIKHLENN